MPNLPHSEPFSKEFFESQIRLKEIGESGQKKLSQSKILVVGAGTLGCACLPWLVSAGIGEIRLADPDRIEPDNLARQILYHREDIGKQKSLTARERLQKRNPNLRLIPETVYATSKTAKSWVQEADIVLDCADNIATSFLLDDLCKEQNKIFVSASAERFGGYVGAFNPKALAYRDIFPALNAPENCAETGILGAAGGIIGALQAQITLALLLNLTPSPLGQLFIWKGEEWRMEKINFQNTPAPLDKKYPVIRLEDIPEKAILIDLRPENSWPELKNSYQQLPRNSSLAEDKQCLIVLICETGALASKKALKLQKQGYRNLALCALKLESEN